MSPVRLTLALLTLALAACGGDASSTDNTFTCGPDSAPVRCAYSAQYCYEVTSGGATVSGECRPVPAGCTSSVCSTCLASIPNQNSCASVTINSLRATTVSVRR